MARFSTLPASEVFTGRGLVRERALVPFVEALGRMSAGRIDLEEGEQTHRVRYLLREAAHRRGLTVHVGTADKGAVVFFKTFPNVRRVNQLAD